MTGAMTQTINEKLWKLTENKETELKCMTNMNADNPLLDVQVWKGSQTSGEIHCATDCSHTELSSNKSAHPSIFPATPVTFFPHLVHYSWCSNQKSKPPPKTSVLLQAEKYPRRRTFVTDMKRLIWSLIKVHFQPIPLMHFVCKATPHDQWKMMSS